MKLKLFITLWLVMLLPPANAWVSVGSSPGYGTCTYTTIQQALNAGASEIRVLNNQDFVENLEINQSVDIMGGYVSCLAASVNFPRTNNTVISGSAQLGPAVIEVYSTNNPTINLHNLTLQDATDTIFWANGGHGLSIGSSNGFIQLFNTVISENDGELGGGIYVGNTLGNLSLILHDSQVENNVASNKGGGIYCAGNALSAGNALIRISGDSKINGNQALYGGGIAAQNGCKLTIDSGHISLGTRGVNHNYATNNGGGIYLDSGAHVSLQGNVYGLFGIFGNNTAPVTVRGNSAGQNGGGIYAINSSSVDVVDGFIYANNAQLERGGAVYLGASIGPQPVTFNMTSSTGTCWRSGECSILSGNKADLGGALYSVDGAEVDIENTTIKFNRANFGTAFYIHNSGSFNLSGSYIYRNGGDDIDYTDKYVIRGFGPVDMSLIHNTIVKNDFINNSFAVIGIYSSSLTLKNSIIRNSGTTVFNDGNTSVTTDFNCLILNENNSLPGTVFDPEFVDPVNHDFHLSANSQAMDFCQNEHVSMLDTDGDTRGWDDPSIVNAPGMTFDPGADESYANDIIFKNSFQ